MPADELLDAQASTTTLHHACACCRVAGALIKPPKRTILKAAHKEQLELTKAINADNEEHFAVAAASQPGSKLSVVSLRRCSWAMRRWALSHRVSLLPCQRSPCLPGFPSCTPLCVCRAAQGARDSHS